MKYEELKQVILLVQDAKNIGWDFTQDGKLLQANNGNYDHEPVTFTSEEQLLEWLEEQYDAEM
ncbi:hypothetical protein [Bacillus sp. FJAT-45350]|uniref:hypothetical protein n=1 Tax=Bacillus sp. FJAT-45350 TaxID=2011014 RepID=UPI000BB72281|nr:hypothetical protein [Bacillus sp. FJAT-45350]